MGRVRPLSCKGHACKKKLRLLLLIPCLALPAFPQAGTNAHDQVAAHARLAQQYLGQHRPELAIPELESVVALDPKNLDAQANLGVLLFFQGSYSKARPHLRAALDMQSNLTKIQALLGMAERREGDIGDARNDLETVFPVITEQKLKTQIGLELIELYTATQELDKASAVVSVLQQADPANPVVLYAAYRIHSDLAGAAMLSLALAAPDSAQMHQLMAHEEARQGNKASARVQYQKALAADPKLPGIHFELAELLNSADDVKIRQEAEAEYKAAAVENPFDDKAQCRLGDIAARNGDAAQALTYYSAALRLQPNDPEAAFDVAKTLILENEQARALPILERAVQLDPTNTAALFRLSTLYRQQGRTADSQHEVEEYKKYKELKAKLEAIFKEMQLQPAGLHEEEQRTSR